MEVVRGLPEAAEQQVIAIGVFDGLHRGHQAILERARTVASTHKLPAGVLTFEPPPEYVLDDEAPTERRLLTRRDKLNILNQLDFDCVYEIEFTRDFAEIPPDEFIRDVIRQRLRARAVVVGHDFRFGHRRAGDTSLLRDRLEDRGVRVHVEPSVDVDGEPVSSTRIRRLIRRGKMPEARHLLGRPYVVLETIQPGEGRGQTIGFPTLNFPLTRTIHPRQGVYLVWLGTEERVPGVANFGHHPTVGPSDDPVLEVHALNDPPSLETGDETHVYFEAFVRSETSFDSVEALKDQIERDVEQARDRFSRLEPPPSMGAGPARSSMPGT